MKIVTSLTLCAFLCSTSMVVAKEERLEEVLSKEELEAIQIEATRQERKGDAADPETKEGEGNGNPYASLLKENGVKTQADKKEESVTPPATRSRSSSYSRDYRRYSSGSNRPGDALKSTPSERAFGR